MEYGDQLGEHIPVFDVVRKKIGSGIDHKRRNKMIGVDKNRRQWPDQIFSPNELKVGMTVTKIYSHFKDWKETYTIIELKERYFTYRESKRKPIQKCFYSDSNLLSYRSGWNQSNYLVKEEE